MSRPTVAIVYGFAEGHLLSRKLRKELASGGFKVIRDPAQADILIVHSGGVYNLPKNARNKLQLIIAPTISWEGQSAARTGMQKTLLDFRESRRPRDKARWLLKSGINGLYVIGKPFDAANMWRAAERLGDYLPEVTCQRIVICYKGDPWSGNTDPAMITRHHSTTFLTADRLHDDIWTSPKEYVTVIQYLYES